MPGRNARFEERFAVQCDGEVRPSSKTDVALSLIVSNVSRRGLQVHSASCLTLHAKLRLRVYDSQGTAIDVEGKPVWSGEDNVYGIKLSYVDVDWMRFIDSCAEKDSIFNDW